MFHTYIRLADLLENHTKHIHQTLSLDSDWAMCDILKSPKEKAWPFPIPFFFFFDGLVHL